MEQRIITINFYFRCCYSFIVDMVVSAIYTNTVQVNESVIVSNGAHILYTYDALDDYISNAASYMITGVEQKQHIIYVDNAQRYQLVIQKLAGMGLSNILSKVSYVNNCDFYLLHDRFSADKVMRNLMKTVQPFIDSLTPIRVWGHVEWNEQQSPEDQLEAYECECDMAISRLDTLTVCAYSGHHISASMQTRMMRTHEYIMTDKLLTRSSLYDVPGKTVIFPSFAEQTKIQNEMDLYKKKLDFVQVISHEVRNPLTVIKAYASMLLNETESLHLESAFAKKLSDIADYVTVIDNEIAHILSTEQMLSSEALWRTSSVVPLPVIEEVVTTLEVKARTQNIQLNKTIKLSGQELMNSNVTGLRLIISNLLSNAVKYSYEGSGVRFQAKTGQQMLWIEVEDQGVGMSEEQLQHLYRKHEKMNVEQSGQGIGLFMVKKLIDHFSGSIDIYSEFGRGTLARVGLPLL